ncbi:MAG: DNA topoisomerase I [Candidatus Pacearchaeota archaeon]|nr:MAG: DNA topoisomerase I [Candidatus Pacearchaeota archaeon]
MPKPKKTREEKIAEEFFPIDESDLKYAVEKPSSGFLILEKNKKQTKHKKSKRLKKMDLNKSVLAKNFPKKGGYELIITEKPQAAKKIAFSLGKAKEKKEEGVSYYELEKNDKKIFVACAVGHLFTLTPKDNSSFPIFDLVWVPNFIVRKKDFTKRYLNVLKKLVGGASEITIATDYDIEGELIGFNVIRFIAGTENANRMKFSTLTEKELSFSYEKKFKSIDFGQAISGETRHILDWYYGINLSRLLMNAIKTTGRFRVFSIGRVQGPTLNIIVKKEKEILNFKPKKYWQVFIKTEDPEEEFIYIKDIFNKEELRKFEDLKGKKGIAKTEKKEKKVPPPEPFNLTSLQSEAYSLYKITPSKTLEIAQSLYLAGLISYPRTSSQKLPPSINYKEILEKLAKKYNAEKLIKREKPVEGNKTDPAHPSIYPTGEFEKLSDEEKKIFDLIVKRFLCLFAEDAIIENKGVRIFIDEFVFEKKGASIKKESWMSLYPKKILEKSVPDFVGEIKIKDVRFEEKETKPPKRYTPASIITELEKRNLGTKATRAMILETLYNRGYIKEQNIKATPLGISLIETLEKHSPIIIDEALTREFEKNLESIQNSKKNFLEKQKMILEKAKETIIKIVNEFKKEETDVGKELLLAIEKLNNQKKQENILDVCPVCKKGNIMIMYSKKNKRYFVACDRYPECKTTYTLPPYGLMKPSENFCDVCDFRKVMAIRKGKKPWEFCFNPKCETNKERFGRIK